MPYVYDGIKSRGSVTFVLRLADNFFFLQIRWSTHRFQLNERKAGINEKVNAHKTAMSHICVLHSYAVLNSGFDIFLCFDVLVYQNFFFRKAKKAGVDLFGNHHFFFLLKAKMKYFVHCGSAIA